MWAERFLLEETVRGKISQTYCEINLLFKINKKQYTKMRRRYDDAITQTMEEKG